MFWEGLNIVKVKNFWNYSLSQILKIKYYKVLLVKEILSNLFNGVWSWIILRFSQNKLRKASD